MDCDHPTTELPDWVIQVDESLSKMESFQPKEEMHRNGKPCIYRVPYSLRRGTGENSEGLYKPLVTVFGPYDLRYGVFMSERNELHNDEAVVHFLRRSGKQLQDYYNAMAGVVEELKGAYDRLPPRWQDNTEAFLKLMVADGFSLLEILHGLRDPETYYAPDSPVLQIHKDPSKMDIFRHDVLLLENQLPLLLLEVLLGVETGGNHNEVCQTLEDYIARLFNMRRVSIRYDQNNKCKHILEVYRKSLLDQVIFKGKKACDPYGSRETRTAGGFQSFHHFNIPSATQLDKVGIGFTTSDTTSLLDISFRRQTLRLPQIVVDEATGSSFFNIIVFEKLHEDAGNEVTSYIYFMRCLIQAANDVSLLQSHGIIRSTLPIDEVFSMFHRLFQDILHDPDESLIYVHWNAGRMLRRRFNKMTDEWQADLFQKYLRSPWAIISVIAAFLLFALTATQTVYTVLSYVNRK